MINEAEKLAVEPSDNRPEHCRNQQGATSRANIKNSEPRRMPPNIRGAFKSSCGASRAGSGDDVTSFPARSHGACRTGCSCAARGYRSRQLMPPEAFSSSRHFFVEAGGVDSETLCPRGSVNSTEEHTGKRLSRVHSRCKTAILNLCMGVSDDMQPVAGREKSVRMNQRSCAGSLRKGASQAQRPPVQSLRNRFAVSNNRHAVFSSEVPTKQNADSVVSVGVD